MTWLAACAVAIFNVLWCRIEGYPQWLKHLSNTPLLFMPLSVFASALGLFLLPPQVAESGGCMGLDSPTFKYRILPKEN